MVAALARQDTAPLCAARDDPQPQPGIVATRTPVRKKAYGFAQPMSSTSPAGTVNVT
jgi:hypothetical protein